MIGATVKSKATKSPHRVRGWNEGTGRWILERMTFGPLVQATPGEMLRDFTGTDPAAVDAPRSEQEILAERDSEATADANDAYRRGQGAKPARERKPPLDSPEDRFANGGQPRQAVDDPRPGRKAALSVLRDPERTAQYDLGLLDVPPAVSEWIARIREAADRA